ncbi:MAG: hypothetical protein VB081_02835 [Christensenella sp.]|uniref:hypothetical protein n=1 Tax=Christensenella sp. TaxID=1935934 RepID=UPI002B1F9921|nr:hypothetical protein [Christensenella sp.]MEA5002415.1 hypothetical protein [Christensenella sp.]
MSKEETREAMATEEAAAMDEYMKKSDYAADGSMVKLASVAKLAEDATNAFKLGGKNALDFAQKTDLENVQKTAINAQTSALQAQETANKALDKADGALGIGSEARIVAGDAYTKADQAKRTAEAAQVGLAGKVDTIDGKGLSANDYTSEEKAKLVGIEAEANKYVHPQSHPAGMIDGLPRLNNRCISDNPFFNIWRRWSDFSLPVGDAMTYTADRWYMRNICGSALTAGSIESIERIAPTIAGYEHSSNILNGMNIKTTGAGSYRLGQFKPWKEVSEKTVVVKALIPQNCTMRIFAANDVEASTVFQGDGTEKIFTATFCGNTVHKDNGINISAGNDYLNFEIEINASGASDVKIFYFAWFYGKNAAYDFGIYDIDMGSQFWEAERYYAILAEQNTNTAWGVHNIRTTIENKASLLIPARRPLRATIPLVVRHGTNLTNSWGRLMTSLPRAGVSGSWLIRDVTYSNTAYTRDKHLVVVEVEPGTTWANTTYSTSYLIDTLGARQIGLDAEIY